MMILKCQGGRPKLRYEENAQICLRGTGCEDVAWTEIAQDNVQWWAVVRRLMKPRETFDQENNYECPKEYSVP
jgi:hypothetical protein